MIRILAALLVAFLTFSGLATTSLSAQTAADQPVSDSQPASTMSKLQSVVQAHFSKIKKGSVKTAQPVIDAIQETGDPAASRFLVNWQSKDLWYRKSDDLIVTVKRESGKNYTLMDITTGEPIGKAVKKEIKQIKPNSGVRALLGAALVASQLVSDDLATRKDSLDSLARDPKPDHLGPLRKAIARESDAGLKADMVRLERLLTMQYDKDTAARVAAIESFSSDLGLDVRARLNPMLDTRLMVAQTAPKKGTFARILKLGSDETLGRDEAYAMLVAKGWAPEDIKADAKTKALITHIADGKVGSIAVSALGTQEARDKAYAQLVERGLAPADPSAEAITETLKQASFYEVYLEPSPEVVAATKATLSSIETKVAWSEVADLFLDGLSLASIFFLAAIGLAITFGVMGVINMAHGEFIMMGAYTGYVIQQFVTNYTLSILLAIPAAFAVTFLAGVAMERLIIRHLYHRPLETLLATFGVSIALQQLAKNIFGTQARPLTSPDWLDGALVINDVISISWIRVAIFGLSVLFFAMLWFTLNKTRLGLETRAVTQNPRMAASMGINPDRINMLTFGLGSGIAGIAGVAIGLFAKVTSELGADYIVQSFMTVVVGGVGNIWGTLAGAAMIGFLQKGIEWFNPSNTLAAQTFMIIFIIIFIQFRPRGIIALKGRAAGD
ncbi:urea ABC transporter permease subunit UrtB [Cohaesibacter intestini]|uniref:urea ABC transporter permease subunit UrtB n=1 Tax=Cohaesibacter intestini TaxID=2211145 RepID=UPI000DEB3A6E|nr:urea ABC transporter permease subunit UrtB [Cohaesibacter intestini]